MPRLRFGAALPAALLALPLAGGAGQESRVSIVPRVGYVAMSALYDGDATYEGIPVRITLEPEAHSAVGLDVDVRLGGGPWSAFAGVAFGDVDIEGEFCAEGFCDGGPAEASTRLLAAGVGREVWSRGEGGPRVRLRAGGALLRIAVEGAEQSMSSPGVFGGADLTLPFASRLALDLSLDDILVRSDTDSLEEDFESAEGGDLELERTWVNSLRASLGLRIDF